MMRRDARSVLLAAGAIIALGGCLFHNAEGPRFYRPASAALDEAGDVGAATAAEAAPTEGAPVRLGSVRSAPFLRERIVWRSSPVEYGLYEQRRWFELPSRYVRRALAATLQATPGVLLGDDPSGARLDVEVLAFDEVLSPTHEAHIALAATLRVGTEKRLDRTFSSRVPIAADDGAANAESMGKALDETVKRVATATAAALAPTKAPAKRTRGK
jgi:ABC-type uncharacterized transport system auxiliary subunit